MTAKILFISPYSYSCICHVIQWLIVKKIVYLRMHGLKLMKFADLFHLLWSSFTLDFPGEGDGHVEIPSKIIIVHQLRYIVNFICNYN